MDGVISPLSKAGPNAILYNNNTPSVNSRAGSKISNVREDIFNKKTVIALDQKLPPHIRHSDQIHAYKEKAPKEKIRSILAKAQKEIEKQRKLDEGSDTVQEEEISSEADEKKNENTNKIQKELKVKQDTMSVYSSRSISSSDVPVVRGSMIKSSGENWRFSHLQKTFKDL